MPGLLAEARSIVDDWNAYLRATEKPISVAIVLFTRSLVHAFSDEVEEGTSYAIYISHLILPETLEEAIVHELLHIQHRERGLVHAEDVIEHCVNQLTNFEMEKRRRGNPLTLARSAERSIGAAAGMVGTAPTHEGA